MADELLKQAEELAGKKAQAKQIIVLMTDYIRHLDEQLSANRREQEQEERLALARTLQRGGKRHDKATMAKALQLALDTLANTIPGDQVMGNGVVPDIPVGPVEE